MQSGGGIRKGPKWRNDGETKEVIIGNIIPFKSMSASSSESPTYAAVTGRNVTFVGVNGSPQSIVELVTEPTVTERGNDMN